ncbi:MAG: DUF4352 domain-containing protein [Candidatus Woesearchaeota archaeon]|nr:DUF4352 domain-containing protein [Candidatus Woesearchaeota archaeon]
MNTTQYISIVLFVLLVIPLGAATHLRTTYTSGTGDNVIRDQYENSAYSRIVRPADGKITTISTLRKRVHTPPPSFEATQGVLLGRFQYKVTDVEIVDTIKSRSTNRPVRSTKGSFVIVDLEVKNVGEHREYLSHPRTLKLVDHEGGEHSLFARAPYDDRFQFNKQVYVDETRTGVLVFEIPEGLEPHQLHIARTTSAGNVFLDLRKTVHSTLRTEPVACDPGSTLLYTSHNGHALGLKSIDYKQFDYNRGKINAATFYVEAPKNNWVSYQLQFTVTRHNAGLSGASVKTISIPRTIKPKNRCFTATVPLGLSVSEVQQEQVIGAALRHAGRAKVRLSDVGLLSKHAR